MPFFQLTTVDPKDGLERLSLVFVMPAESPIDAVFRVLTDRRFPERARQIVIRLQENGEGSFCIEDGDLRREKEDLP